MTALLARARKTTSTAVNPSLRFTPTLTRANNVNSVGVALPAGIVAGDHIMLVGGHGFGVNLPAGYTNLEVQTGSNANGRTFYKVADGTEGGTTLTVTFGGTYYGYLALFIVKDAVGIRSVSALRQAGAPGGGFDPPTKAATLGDLVLYGFYVRANVTPTLSRGTTSTTNNGANASGLAGYEAVTTARLGPLATFAGAGAGYASVIIMQGPNALPSLGNGMFFAAGEGVSSLTKPAGLAVDDVVFMVCGSNNSGIALPAGFTTVYSGLVEASNYAAIGWKRMVAGELTGTWTPAGTNSCGFSVYRGAQDPTFDAAVTFTTLARWWANFAAKPAVTSGQVVRLIRSASNNPNLPIFEGYATGRVQTQHSSWGVGIGDQAADALGVDAAGVDWTVGAAAGYVHLTATILPV